MRESAIICVLIATALETIACQELNPCAEHTISKRFSSPLEDQMATSSATMDLYAMESKQPREISSVQPFGSPNQYSTSLQDYHQKEPEIQTQSDFLTPQSQSFNVGYSVSFTNGQPKPPIQPPTRPKARGPGDIVTGSHKEKVERPSASTQSEDFVLNPYLDLKKQKVTGIKPKHTRPISTTNVKNLIAQANLSPKTQKFLTDLEPSKPTLTLSQEVHRSPWKHLGNNVEIYKSHEVSTHFGNNFKLNSVTQPPPINLKPKYATPDISHQFGTTHQFGQAAQFEQVSQFGQPSAQFGQAPQLAQALQFGETHQFDQGQQLDQAKFNKFDQTKFNQFDQTKFNLFDQTKFNLFDPTKFNQFDQINQFDKAQQLEKGKFGQASHFDQTKLGQSNQFDQAHKFDHQKALGRSEGFDYSNAVEGGKALSGDQTPQNSFGHTLNPKSLNLNSFGGEGSKIELSSFGQPSAGNGQPFGKSGDDFGKSSNFGNSANFGKSPDNFGKSADNFPKSPDNFGLSSTNFGQSSGHLGQSSSNFGQGVPTFSQPSNAYQGPNNFEATNYGNSQKQTYPKAGKHSPHLAAQMASGAPQTFSQTTPNIGEYYPQKSADTFGKHRIPKLPVDISLLRDPVLTEDFKLMPDAKAIPIRFDTRLIHAMGSKILGFANPHKPNDVFGPNQKDVKVSMNDIRHLIATQAYSPNYQAQFGQNEQNQYLPPGFQQEYYGDPVGQHSQISENYKTYGNAQNVEVPYAKNCNKHKGLHMPDEYYAKRYASKTRATKNLGMEYDLKPPPVLGGRVRKPTYASVYN